MSGGVAENQQSAHPSGLSLAKFLPKSPAASPSHGFSAEAQQRLKAPVLPFSSGSGSAHSIWSASAAAREGAVFICVDAYCSCFGVLKEISVLGPDFKRVSSCVGEEVETVRQHRLYLP